MEQKYCSFEVQYIRVRANPPAPFVEMHQIGSTVRLKDLLSIFPPELTCFPKIIFKRIFHVNLKKN